ncbi:MAG: AI-2E family transporter [Firmicutes bacterium]|nr:AI-2E family transporter [Bacillota bacterium]
MRSLWRSAGWLALSLGALYLIFVFRVQLKNILAPFVLAVIIAYILNPVVEFLAERRIPRVVGILIIYAAVVLLLTLLALLIVPGVVAEANELGQRLPALAKQVNGLIAEVQSRYERLRIPPTLQGILDNNLEGVQRLVLGFLQGAVNSLIGVFGQVFLFVIAPILAFYILKDLELIKRSISSALPGSYRRRLTALLGEIDDTLGSWTRGQLIISLIVAALTMLGLQIIGMDFVLMIGLIAGITNVIPYFGPIIGSIPAVILGFLNEPVMALKVVAVMVAVQQLESNVLSPQILGRSLGLHPLLVIFALIAGGQLFGFLGLIFAVPAMAVIKVILRHSFQGRSYHSG